jgi:hypothetical protein
MKWNKLQNIFCPANNYEWMFSHAANPFAEQIEEHIFRIYFTCRDTNNRSHIACLDLDMRNFQITRLDTEPLLKFGDLGLFDDSGVAMGFLLHKDNQKYLYYLGWNLKVTVPWLNTIGLAIFDEKTQKFEKNSLAPMMDRSQEDPYSISYPSVLCDNGKYRMWYGSNLSWGKEQSEMKHVFKYAESQDAIRWTRTNQIAVNLMHKNEYALSKPFVIKEKEEIYRMWYSYRACSNIETYRIGYAESLNGLDWTRKDEEVGIDVSKSGWDSEMICYPHIFDYKDNRYMLYNGNSYGKTGFGIAILEK